MTAAQRRRRHPAEVAQNVRWSWKGVDEHCMQPAVILPCACGPGGERCHCPRCSPWCAPLRLGSADVLLHTDVLVNSTDCSNNVDARFAERHSITTSEPLAISPTELPNRFAPPRMRVHSENERQGSADGGLCCRPSLCWRKLTCL